MSANTIKNLPKDKRIVWEGDKTPSGSGDTYTYGQSKKGAVRGSKKRAIRTPYGDDVDVQIDKHMSFPDKKGGSDTYRRKVRGKHKTTIGRGTKTSDTDTTIDSTYTKDLTIKECSTLMRGELDSLVTLTIYRSATKEKIKLET